MSGSDDATSHAGARSVRVLWLLRHGHAAAAAPGGGDPARPLDARGQQEILVAASRLERFEPKPRRVLVSTARRTLETASILERELEWAGAMLHPDARLYLAAPATLLAALREQPPSLRALMIVGHNPGLSELVAYFGGAHFAGLSLETGELCRIEFAAPDWDTLDGAAPLRIDRWPPDGTTVAQSARP